MKNAGWLVVTLVLSGAVGASADPLDVRVMTFNVKQHNPNSKISKDSAAHWERRRALAFKVLRDGSSDIVGLQEPYRHQVDDIRKALSRYE